MPKGLSLLLFLGYCTLIQSLFLTSATAQVTPDSTTNTTVDANGNDFTIHQGDRAGTNLFHSFGEFSVPTDGSAFFNNAADIVNIFSRVTGGNISNIDGLLGANGSANLFLLNPAGIIFGENARLDIGGSFFGTTADSLLFDDGTEFSARDSDNPPLLTINTPIGLGLGDNPGDIVNQSVVQNSTGDVVGLEVTPGKSLTLVGGNINFESGRATARGGKIELGGLSSAGTVTFNFDGSLSFPEDVARADITLNNAAKVDVRGTDSGSITINARNLNLEAGDSGSSQIRAGIAADSTSSEAQAGDININNTENITVDNSSISNQVSLEAVGNSGNIIITTGNLNLTNGGTSNTNIFGQGNGGSVNITATDTITIDGQGSDGIPSSVDSRLQPEAEGNSGDLIITTGSLNVTNGARVTASTLGQGNGGSVNITATDTISLDGERLNGLGSAVASQVLDAEGDAGGVTITTGSLVLNNGGAVDASTLGQGNAGSVEITASDTITFDGEDSRGISSGAISQVNSRAVGNAGGVTISTGSLSLTNGGQVDASTFGQGNAGAVEINASDTITFDGEDSDGIPSGATSRVNSDAEGDAGGVTITTGSLSLTNGGRVSASTNGQGNAGLVEITASDTITIDGEDSGGIPSGATSQVNPGAVGNAGGVTISTGSLSLTNGGRFDASTFGQGNAGSVEITSSDTITFDGEDLGGIPSGATSLVNSDAEGDAGGVTITTGSLSLTNGGRVSASTLGQGNAGAVEINASDTITFDGEDSDGIPSGATSRVNSDAEGDAGGVTITTGSLSLTNGGRVSASTNGQGNAGLVEITASDTITIDGEQSGGFQSGATSRVNSDAVGDAGGVTMTTGSLSLTNGGRVSASTFGQGNAGSVEITASDTITIDGEDSGGSNSGATSGVGSSADGDAGGVTITTGSLSLTNGGLVDASTFGQGNAGDVTVSARESITITGVTEDTASGLFANAHISSGTGGNINVFTNQLTLDDGGTIEASNFDSFGVFDPGTGEPGNINIEANSLSLTNEAIISAATQSETGNTANINLQLTEDLTLRDNSFISARALEDADGGNLNINARFILGFPSSGNGNDLTPTPFFVHPTPTVKWHSYFPNSKIGFLIFF